MTHTAAQEGILAGETSRATAADAQAAAAAVAGGPQDVGEWGPVTDWPVVGVHVALLPNGKVLAYDSVGDNATESYPVQDHTRATVWDPQTGEQTPVNVATGYNIFCSGLAHLVDGRVHRGRQQGPAAQWDRPDAPVRSGDEHVEPRPRHGGRAVVPHGDAAAQRRDAHHVRPGQHA